MLCKYSRKTGSIFQDDKLFCGACIEGKQKKSQFVSRTQRSKEPGAVIHADLCGPMENTTFGNALYFLCFTCDYSRFRIVYFLKNKSETAQKVAEMIALINNHYSLRVRTFQCDGGKEFDNNEVKSIMSKSGIKLVITNPYSPEQNGCAERSNQTIVNLARTMLLSKKLPKALWAEAVNTAVFVLNRTGPSGEDSKTPFELFTGKSARINILHIFGSECYVREPDQKRKKWDARGKPGIFVGYAEDIRGYRVWVKPGKSVIRRVHVDFVPEETGKTWSYFPAKDIHESQQPIGVPAVQARVDTSVQARGPGDHVGQVQADGDAAVEPQAGVESVFKNKVEVHDFSEDNSDDSFYNSILNDSDVTLTNDSFGDLSSQEEGHPDEQQHRRKLRDRNTIKAPNRLIEADIAVAEFDEPRTFEEAIKSPYKTKWIEAMKEEMEALKKNSTWDLVELPAGRKPITNKWIYRIKRNAKGEIDRFRARLVARGFNQQKGIDYDETFSPVARFDTIRSLLSIAANENLELKQFDFKSAYLNGFLKEEIFMEQPEGFEDSTGRVCRLIKSLYGLKQSSRCWNERLKKELFKLGLNESTADSCLFFRVENDYKILISLYVDDGLIAATNRGLIDDFFAKL